MMDGASSPALHVDGRVVAVDEEGYLLDPHDWDVRVAEAIAAGERIDLGDRHWFVIRFIRERFESRQAVPEARTLLKAMAERYGRDNASRRSLHELFPYGYGQQACKIAGMRKPRKLMLDV
jgi:tRNA 2-thiouridine synthesizing protein E